MSVEKRLETGLELSALGSKDPRRMGKQAVRSPNACVRNHTTNTAGLSAQVFRVCQDYANVFVCVCFAESDDDDEDDDGACLCARIAASMQ
eukprot:2867752-Rhodomonas_salina.1